ncbi:MAG TPA: hypothetical protein VGB34_02115 [Candidatus Limnocylindria bacterium]|jgi:hypothetical protein
MTVDGTADLAAEIRRRGLAAPARLLLEAHRPLQPLLGDLATFVSPLLRPLLGGRASLLGAAFGDDSAIDRLIEQLADADDD